MAIRTHEEEFEYFSTVKEINMQYLEEMKRLFDTMLESGNFANLDFFNDFPKKKDFIMTGEAYKLQTCCLICKNEFDFNGRVSFFLKDDDVASAFEKLDYLTFMLRRIEMNPTGEFSSPAYEYIKNNNVSIEAIITLVRRGAFEWELEIAKSILQQLEVGLSNEEKLEWLYLISEVYKDTGIFMQLANLQLELGYYKACLSTMRKIENPTDEIKELILQIGGLVNE